MTASHPYRVTQFSAVSDDILPSSPQSVSYTCFDRPSVITENGRTTAFTYNGDDDRARMTVTDSSGVILTRYSVGGCYERDEGVGLFKEKLYLGGDYYSAPMVYVRTDSTSQWTLCNIGRDYLCSVTSVSSSDGTAVAEYSYDPWGRMRSPQTLEPYPFGAEPELYLGRGYTGHEHLACNGLVNMNARLYDPVTGRFLSPDPYVQSPGFTQSYNRYTYALNNPLKYEDQDGEWIHLLIGGIIGGVSNILSNWSEIKEHGFWTGLGYFAIGAGVGVATAAVGGWSASVTKAAGVFAGASVGAASGALTGGASNLLLNGGNNLIAGNGFFDDWKGTTLNGMMSGAFSGAVSGGIQGYKYAKENGANPWTNKVNGSESEYKTDVKQGIPIQVNAEEGCYANSSAYADSGHGNHTVEEFLASNKYAAGGDVSALKDVANARLAEQGSMKDLIDNFSMMGGAIMNPNLEIMATISGLEGKSHWINIFKLSSFKSLRLFGGGVSNGYTISYWDPATGRTSSTSEINFFKVFKF